MRQPQASPGSCKKPSLLPHGHAGASSQMAVRLRAVQVWLRACFDKAINSGIIDL